MIPMTPCAIARALGGEAHGNNITVPGPGHSPADRSLSIRIDPHAPDGYLIHSFAGDDPIICKDYVSWQLGLVRDRSVRRGKPARDCRPRLLQRDDEARRVALAVWHEAVSPCNTLVERYLAARGIELPAEIVADDALRFHPACVFRLLDGPDRGQWVRLPTMIALMRDAATNAPRGVHRTALRPDGSGKAAMPDGRGPKRMLGRCAGAVVKLVRDDEVTAGLGIAEGIETALTAICAGWRPVWACGSAGAITRFPVLGGIESLTVFADSDEAGLKTARACGCRWAEAGRAARILLPPRDGADWNDISVEAE